MSKCCCKKPKVELPKKCGCSVPKKETPQPPDILVPDVEAEANEVRAEEAKEEND